MKAWNFDRCKNGKLIADRIRVHAENIDLAWILAVKLHIKTCPKREIHREYLIFVDNEPCVSKCSICGVE